MDVSRQPPDVAVAERGPRARTRRLMVETATRLMQDGAVPSVTDVAEAAQVSRATAYRYFPSQAALVHAVVYEALGPILEWKSPGGDAEAGVADLFETALPRIDAFEATFRAALKHALDQWAQRRAGTLGNEPPFKRGHRIDRLRAAIAPLGDTLPEAGLDRLAKALSLLFGIETLVIMKDIWDADAEEARALVQWMARILVRGAAADAAKS